MAGFGDPQGANWEELTTRAGHELRSPYSPVQFHFITRLTRLLALRRECQDLFAADDWHLHLLRKAIYSTYCDCLALGVEGEAKEIIHVVPPPDQKHG